MKRLLLLTCLAFMGYSIQAQIRFQKVNPTTDEFTIKNYGGTAVDISGYRLCSEFRYAPGPLAALTIIEGNLLLGAGESISLSGFTLTDAAADFGLYLPGGSFGSADAMVDFLQWGAGGIGREGVAVNKGIWSSGDFIEGDGPYVYNGDGNENGLVSWGLAEANPRFSYVDPVNNVFEITNFGTDAIDLSNYRLCSEFRYSPGPLSVLTIESGSLDLAAGESVRISGWSVNQNAADFGLYLPTGSFSSADAMVDFLQWGAGGIGRENVAVSKGIWAAGTFIDAGAPYNYTGDGVQTGAEFWTGTLQPDYVAKLTGSQEVQPVMTTGYGTVYAAIEGDSLIIWGEFSGLRGEFNSNIAGGAHIHFGYAGQNGGIAIPLQATLDTDLKGGTFEMANNRVELNEEQKIALLNRGLYVNIHTTAVASGEIRGQVLAKSDAYYMSNLFGGNEVPSVMTTASGALSMELIGDQLIVTGSFMNLEGKFNPSIGGTGAHLHNGLAGANGGISIPLNVTTSDSTSGVFTAANNTFTLTPEQKESIIARGLYVNLHTTKVPSGELRGQVSSLANIRFRANLSGANESVPVLTGATGELFLELKGDMLIASGTFQNLEGDLATQIAGGAHIHVGMAGSNGDVAFPLSVSMDGDMRSGTFEAVNNTFTLDESQISMLLERKMYVNIHSQLNPSGELRGQILPEGMFVLNGFLSGTNEVTPVLTTASGAIKAEVLGDKLTFSGSFDNLSSEVMTALAGGAHLHLAPAGSNGGVAIPLSISLNEGNQGGNFEAKENSFTISSGMLDTLRWRYGYVNIHSMDAPGGELRAQLLHEATAYFTSTLSGTSEVPSVNTSATGALVAEYVNGKLWVSGSFNNLESDFNPDIAGGAHLHAGLAGQNGAPILFLNPALSDDNRAGKFAVGQNAFEVSTGIIDSIRMRMFYTNIHSVDIPSGEIRGQMLPLATAYFTTSLSGKNEIQPVGSTGVGAMKGELHGNKLIVTGAFSALNGAYAASHLHIATVGSNGGVAVALNPEVDLDGTSAKYLPDSNTYELDEVQLGHLLNSSIYTNIHSEFSASGELRGQMLPESNFYPSADADISAPADGALVEITGDPATPFVATWNEATDDNPLAYIWQLSPSVEFNLNIVTANVGQSTTFATTFGVVDSLLAMAGVEMGDTITLYHRATATDGSVCTEGQAASVRLIRGMVTALDQEIAEQISISIYPSPVIDQAQINIASPQHLQGKIRVMDIVGKEIVSQKMNIVQGTQNVSLNLSNYRSGIYLIQLIAEGTAIQTLKVVKR